MVLKRMVWRICFLIGLNSGTKSGSDVGIHSMQAVVLDFCGSSIFELVRMKIPRELT